MGKKMEYTSVLCEYCSCTDYGSISVNSGPHNLCGGRGCVEAYINYMDEHPEDLHKILTDFF